MGKRVEMEIQHSTKKRGKNEGGEVQKSSVRHESKERRYVLH